MQLENKEIVFIWLQCYTKLGDLPSMVNSPAYDLQLMLCTSAIVFLCFLFGIFKVRSYYCLPAVQYSQPVRYFSTSRLHPLLDF